MYSSIKTITSQVLSKLPSEVESLIWNHVEVKPSKLINHVKMYKFLNASHFKFDVRQLNYINEVAYGSIGDDSDNYDTLCGICLSGDYKRYKKFKERTTNEDFKNMKFVSYATATGVYQVTFIELVSLMVGLGGNIRIINDMMPNNSRNSIYNSLFGGLYIAGRHDVLANLISIFKVYVDNSRLFNTHLIDVKCVFNDINTFHLIKEMKFDSEIGDNTVKLIQFMAFNGCNSVFVNDRIDMIDWTGCDDEVKDIYMKDIRLAILAGRYERGDIPVCACSLEIIHMISDNELIKKLLKYHIDEYTPYNAMIMGFITDNNTNIIKYIINKTSYKLSETINYVFKCTNSELYDIDIKSTYNNIEEAVWLMIHADPHKEIFNIDQNEIIQDLEIAIGNMSADEINHEYNSRKSNICFTIGNEIIEENIFRIMEKCMAINRRPEVEEKNTKRTKL